MNELTTMTATETMSSLEIAELTGKQHKHVLRDIDSMIEGLSKDGPDLDHKEIQGVTIEKDNRGYTRRFNLDKEMTYTLITGYSILLRNKVIKRWQELEAKQGTDLSTLSPILQVAIKLEQEQARLAAEQDAQAARLTAVEGRQDMMDGDTGYQTVTAWCRTNDMKLSLGEANKLGRRCAAYCKKHGITTGKVPDERFGTVKSYPAEVIDAVFADL